MVASPSTRPDEPLDPPTACCGREFRLRRALEAHARSHGACGKSGCTFAGSRAVLRLHVLGLVLAVTATRAIHVEVDAAQLGATVHTDDPPLHRINPLYVGCHSDSGFTHQRGRRADVRGAAQPRAGERGALL